MRVFPRHFAGLRLTLTVSFVVLLAVIPALAAEAAQPAASHFEPTMADYLGVYDALQNYRFGVEKHDQQALQSAFWEDGTDIIVPGPGQEIRVPLKEGASLTPLSGPPGPNGGPPPGSGSGGEVWHLPLDSYIHFDSATRATHFEYFLSIYPQPEKKRPEGATGNMQESRTSIVGWPGHYEDILEKRHGEWRILQRKTLINQK